MNFKIVFLLIFVLFLASCTSENITGQVTHSQYSSFSSPESGYVIEGTSLVVSDDVIFHTGYYSVNGASWVPFGLSGSSYEGSSYWLGGSATHSLPDFGVGEHFVLVYSCSLVDSSWDCHNGKWQLKVVTNKESVGSLVAHWDFQNTVQDNIGVFQSTLESGTLVNDDEKGSVLSVGNGVLRVKDNSELDLSTQLTLSIWFKATENIFSKIITKPISQGADPWEAYTLDIRDGQVRFILSDGQTQSNGGWNNVNAPISLHKWHHVVGTYDGNIMRLYVDGLFVGSKIINKQIIFTNEDLLIGRYLSGNSFHGLIDDVMIYDMVLDITEVKKLYENQKPLIVQATCIDKKQNQGETDIDCGGPCSECVLTSTCGDNICSDDESCNTCSQDCNSCTSGADIRFDATFEHIGIRYVMNNNQDLNLNSVLSVFYRKMGSSGEFKPSAPGMRKYPSLIVDKNPIAINVHATSVMFLEPNTKYELKIVYTDPDGISTSDIKIVQTKAYLKEKMNYKYVRSGNGGGSGTINNPYRGLQIAADNAQPGDTFLVADGVYAPFKIMKSGAKNNPITFRSQNPHGAIIDGNNVADGIIIVGAKFYDELKYIIIDGFTIKNGKMGIRVHNTNHIAVKNNNLYDVYFGFWAYRNNGHDHDAHITNNRIVGRVPWPALIHENYHGVLINGKNNVISYNYIAHFNDGIHHASRDSGDNKGYSIDVHNNEIIKNEDDGVELDYTYSNMRVYENRIYNSITGISAQPHYGGPYYMFRNVIYNMEYVTYKLNVEPAGILIFQNTAAKHGVGYASNTLWKNTLVKNNVMVSSRAFVNRQDIPVQSVDDWDYNAYYSSGKNYWVWGETYSSLAAFRLGTGQEKNGFMISSYDLRNWPIPTDVENIYLPSQRNPFPSSNSVLIDKGLNLPNVNDKYVTDGKPDVGAYEYGEPLPRYGYSW